MTLSCKKVQNFKTPELSKFKTYCMPTKSLNGQMLKDELKINLRSY